MVHLCLYRGRRGVGVGVVDSTHPSHIPLNGFSQRILCSYQISVVIMFS